MRTHTLPQKLHMLPATRDKTVCGRCMIDSMASAVASLVCTAER
jgi:hypothetical protein